MMRVERHRDALTRGVEDLEPHHLARHGEVDGAAFHVVQVEHEAHRVAQRLYTPGRRHTGEENARIGGSWSGPGIRAAAHDRHDREQDAKAGEAAGEAHGRTGAKRGPRT